MKTAKVFLLIFFKTSLLFIERLFKFISTNIRKNFTYEKFIYNTAINTSTIFLASAFTSVGVEIFTFTHEGLLIYLRQTFVHSAFFIRLVDVAY